MSQPKQVSDEKLSITSSVADDVWHPKTDATAYEWWYFDALSDDGKEAFVVIFLDNFIFSPRYNEHCRKLFKKTEKAKREHVFETDANGFPGSDSDARASIFPALAFIYYRDGKPVYRAINEFTASDFSADTQMPSCRMGENNFTFDSAPYGSGYVVTIKANLRGGRKIEAKLEWLSIESDFLPREGFGDIKDRHSWNLVAPRSDVTGSIKVLNDVGKTIDVRHFRGTGYHDHNTDARWMPGAIQDWQWGRAHFSDATAVYYRYREIGESEPAAKLFLIKNNELNMFDAEYLEGKSRRSVFGLKYPKEISLTTREGIRLEINQTKPIDQSFFYLRFLSEAKLVCPDADTHEAYAITEHLAPKTLKYRWLDWLVNMRIGRNGKGSFL